MKKTVFVAFLVLGGALLLSGAASAATPRPPRPINPIVIAPTPMPEPVVSAD